MKCAFCNAELKKGCLYCTSCGKEVQIVPDYSEFDEDYINGLIGSDSENEDPVYNTKNVKESKKSEQKKKALKLKKEQERRKKKIIIASIIIAILLLLVVGVIVVLAVSNSRNNSVDYQISKAKEAVAEKKTDIAISYYERALVLDNDNIDVLQGIAEIYVSKGNYKDAIKYYKQILEIDSHNKIAIKAMVDIYDKDKDYDAINKLYDSVKNESGFDDIFAKYVTSKPSFDVSGGIYRDVIKVSISSPDKEDIFYTLNGRDPVEYGIRYDEPIEFDEEGEYQLKAVCVNDLGISSEVVSENYTIQFSKPAMPVVSPDGGSYISETYVTIKVPKGCTAYYLWGTSDPTTSSTKYKRPFKVPEGNNVLSVIVVNNKTQKSSEVYRGRFEYYAE